MLIDKTLLDQLTAEAASSPRLSQHFDLRDSSDDESQRMLNAIEPGAVIPIHRHTQTSEEVPYMYYKLNFVLLQIEHKTRYGV